MPVPIDLTGRVFGRLTAIRMAKERRGRILCWVCACTCGNIKVITRTDLQTGDTRSCGCLQIEGVIARRRASATHGATRNNGQTPEYRSWHEMRRRCLNPRAIGYSGYGGRGISICARWDSFEAFLADMGPKPSPCHSIDRWPDNDGNYEPGNCRWATPREQAQNRRTSARLTIAGETQTVTAWARHFGVKVPTAWSRIRLGWPPEIAVSTPPITNRKGTPRGASHWRPALATAPPGDMP